MAPTIPVAVASVANNRLCLSTGIHDALDAFPRLAQDLTERPTHLQELVPIPASCAGAVDACGVGVGGVVFSEPGVQGRISTGNDAIERNA